MRRYSAKETYNLEEHTSRSHPIVAHACVLSLSRTHACSLIQATSGRAYARAHVCCSLSLARTRALSHTHTLVLLYRRQLVRWELVNRADLLWCWQVWSWPFSWYRHSHTYIRTFTCTHERTLTCAHIHTFFLFCYTHWQIMSRHLTNAQQRTDVWIHVHTCIHTNI